MSDAAKHAALLIALGAKPKGDMEDDEHEPEHEDIETAAADDLFDAIKGRDRDAFHDALKRYVTACVNKSEDDEEEPDEDDEHGGY